jgi:hypothetical protein
MSLCCLFEITIETRQCPFCTEYGVNIKKKRCSEKLIFEKGDNCLALMVKLFELSHFWEASFSSRKKVYRNA